MDNLATIWNMSIEKKDRPIEPRERLFASELGGSMIDRFHKLKGTPYTNPPNSRSMRKFMAGDIWEWIIKTVLIRAGIPFTTQERVELNYDGLLPISGRLDFIIGGAMNAEEALKRLELEDIPDFIKRPTMAIIDALRATYPDGNIPKKVIEIKSVGSFIFESLESQDNPRTHHMLQGAIYGLTTKLPVDIVYVCRDDCRLLQYNIDKIIPDLEKEIKKDLDQITKYHKDDIEPPKEELITFEAGKFKTNWKIQYSPYLTMLYTYTADGKEKPIESPDEYFEAFSPLVSSWNRVLKRITDKAPMTKSNLEKVEEMKKYGFETIITNLLKTYETE